MHELPRLWRKELSPPVALGLPMKRTRSELRGMHVMVLCILAFIVFVPRSRAQAPVFRNHASRQLDNIPRQIIGKTLVACEVDVLPAERGEVLEQLKVEGLPVSS